MKIVLGLIAVLIIIILLCRMTITPNHPED